jgi:hypothetical protein
VTEDRDGPSEGTWIGTLLFLSALGAIKRAANRAFGALLQAIGIRRDPDEGDDGSPR